MNKQRKSILTEAQIKGFNALIKYYIEERKQGRDRDNLADKLSDLKAKIEDGTLALRKKQFQAAQSFDQIFLELNYSIQVPLQKEKATQFFNSAKGIGALLSESCMESVGGNEQIKAKVTEIVPKLLTGIDFSFGVSGTLNGVGKFFKDYLEQLQSNFKKFLLEVKNDTTLFTPLVEIYVNELQQYEFNQSRSFLKKFLVVKPEEKKRIIERLCSSNRMSLLHTHMEEEYAEKFSALSSELKCQEEFVGKEILGFNLKAIADDSALTHFNRFFEMSMVVYGEGRITGQQFKERVCEFFKSNVPNTDLEVQAKQFVTQEISRLIMFQSEKNNSTPGQSESGCLSRLDVLKIAAKNSIPHAVQLQTAFSFLASHEKDQTNESGESGLIVALYKGFFDKMNAEIEEDVFKKKIDNMTLSGKKVSEDDLTKVNAALEAALKKNMTSCFEGIDGLGQFDSEIKVHKDQYLFSGTFSSLPLTEGQTELSKLVEELENLLSQVKEVLTNTKPLTALLSQVVYDKVKGLSSEIESKRKSLDEIKDTLKEGLSKAGELKSIISLFTSIDTYQQAAAALKIANEHLQDKVIEHNKAYSVLKAQALLSITLTATELKAPISHTTMTVTEGLDVYVRFNELLEQQQRKLKADEQNVNQYFDSKIKVLCDKSDIGVPNGVHAEQVEIIQKAVNNKITEYHKQLKTLKDFSSTVEIAATEIDLALPLSSETLDQRITRLKDILDNLNMQQEKLKQGTSLLLEKVKEIESSLDIDTDYSVCDMSECLNNIWVVLDKRIREYNKKAECFAKRKAIVNSQNIPAPFSELNPNLLPEIGGCDENQSLGVRLVGYGSTVKKLKASEVELKLKIDSFEENAKTAFDNANSDQERLKYCLESQLGLFSSKEAQVQGVSIDYLAKAKLSISSLPEGFWRSLEEHFSRFMKKCSADATQYEKVFSDYFSEKSNHEFVMGLLGVVVDSMKDGIVTKQADQSVRDYAARATYSTDLKKFENSLAALPGLQKYAEIEGTGNDLLKHVKAEMLKPPRADIYRIMPTILRIGTEILSLADQSVRANHIEETLKSVVRQLGETKKETLLDFKRIFGRLLDLIKPALTVSSFPKAYLKQADEAVEVLCEKSQRFATYYKQGHSIANGVRGVLGIFSAKKVDRPDGEQESTEFKK